MDPKSLSAILAAASTDPMTLNNTTNSSLSSLAFGTQMMVGTDSGFDSSSNTHNHHEAAAKTSFLLNSQQLNDVFAVANLKFDSNQFTATSPNNNFIAASPLSSISSLSSIATDASPTPFPSLSTLSPTDLQHLSKLISPGAGLETSSSSAANDSAEVFNRLRGVLAQSINNSSVATPIPTTIQTLSNAQSPLFNPPMISTGNQNECSLASQLNTAIDQSCMVDQMEDSMSTTASGSRRIRRRRPKSPKSQSAKKSNTAVAEIKQEQHQMNDDESNTIGDLSDSSMDCSYASASNTYSVNSNEEMTETLTEEELSRRQKTCRVCGDHATGYNFNVISCESCKAFFRRNALRPKEFKCPYSGDCEINAVSRRFCQLCRLNKCFHVGMKKEWILNDDQLKRRKNSRLNSLKSVGSVASNDPLSPQQIQSPSNHSNLVIGGGLQAQLPSLPSLLTPNQSIENNVVKREPIESTLLNQLPHTSQPQQSTSAFINPLQQINDIRMLQEQTNNNSIALHQILNISSSNAQHPSNFMPILSQYGRLQQMGQQTPTLHPAQQVKSPIIEQPIENPIALQAITQTDAQMRTNLQQMANVSVEEYTQQFMQSRTTQPSAFTPSSQYNMPPVTTPSSQYNMPPVTTPSSQYNMPPVTTPINNVPINNMPMNVESNQVNYDQANSQQNMTAAVGASPLESPQQTSSQVSSPSGFIFPSFFDWSPATFKMMEESIQEEFESTYSSGDLITHDTPNQIEFKETEHGDNHANYQLNSSELCELDVVRNAYACMNEPLTDAKDTETLKKKDHSPADLMIIMDIIMRRFVKMTKKLSAFNTLSQEAKFVLLKSAMIKMVTYRGASRFDPKRLCYVSQLAGRQKVNISWDFFDNLNHNCQKSNFIKFCYNIHDQIRQNDVVINLIGLILLFENTDVIKDDKDKLLAQKYHALYNNLLRRYIESVHGNEAGSIIASIPRTLNDLNQVSTVAETIFAGRVKMDGTRRLPMEIFKTSTDEVLPSPPNQQPTTSA